MLPSTDAWGRIRVKAYILAGLLAMAATEAAAYCSEPSFSETAPDAPGTYERPDVPYCLQEYRWSGRHTCDDWEIDSYQNEVNDYVDELNDYLSEVVAFANEATRYAQEADDYARCEAQEVVSQHK